MSISGMRKQYKKWLERKARENDQPLIRRLSEVLPVDFLRDLYQDPSGRPVWSVSKMRQAFREEGYVSFSIPDMAKIVADLASSEEVREWWARIGIRVI